ncbi:DUF4396 domain-containing protein [Ilyomonas limi]|uniref:DUF4396 domain-containing protein n=1 Tax=Ilyomonas limi TaxID=2575867 RepID=A0A4U3KYQ8_9BACT|nr:DUF4396 domain-containing protein [Ilyomonas limi]TKK66296.1 DUF4396 domain-containing protein [Ilyomonas limi]
MQTFLVIWFILTAVSVAYVAYDLMVRTPEMKVMKWGWVVVTLYTGIFGLITYILSCREPSPGTHEKFVAPLWKQTVGSTIHCMAGDATGVIVVAFITALLNLPMGIDSILEYIAGFAFGLFIFQSLFMKDMLGGSYAEAVRKTWYPEWMSMNFVMAGMIPVMIILMTGDMRNMEVKSLRFWGIMSLASLVGGVLAIPVNWWMVKNKLKHGMGTERVLGKGGAKENNENKMGMDMPGMDMKATDKGVNHSMHAAKTGDNMKRMDMNSYVSLKTKITVAIISIIVLAIGISAAGYWGDFSMKPQDNRPMKMNKKM